MRAGTGPAHTLVTSTSDDACIIIIIVGIRRCTHIQVQVGW